MNKTSKNKNDSSWSIKSVFIPIIAFVVFSLCFFPIVIAGRILLYFIAFDKFWHFLLLPFIIYIGIAIVVVSILLISGVIIKIFKIYYKPGIFDYNYSNKTSFRWIIICSLYTPCRKMIEIFPLGGLKNVYYRLLGMKIGENSLVGGTIMDPCLTEIGDNCTIGLYSVIYGHIHDFEKELLILDKIKIGNNCVIGAGAFIMPGAVIKDDVKVAAGAVVTKNQILEKGKIYAGIPAKEIIKKNK